MCRTSLWGVAGFIACAYFTWVAFSHVARASYSWPHDAWTAATYVVWIVLLSALTVDTRCWRERMFFGVLVAEFSDRIWIDGVEDGSDGGCADDAGGDWGTLGGGWAAEFDDGGKGEAFGHRRTTGHRSPVRGQR